MLPPETDANWMTASVVYDCLLESIVSELICLQAIEAEADANSAFKEAYNNSFHTDSSTQQPIAEGR